jgi:NADH-quinone oxidoreductase subunit C
MSDVLTELGETIAAKLPDAVTASGVSDFGDLVLNVKLDQIPRVVEFLKSNSAVQVSTLIDLTAVDYPSRAVRFEMVYHFLSMYTNTRIRIKAQVAEDGIVPSIHEIHPGANWFEREVFDMYGVLFSGHPDLRRIVTDYGFRGYPLRKDFPTTGYTELRYDEVAKRVVYEPVSLTQEYRQFDFMSPWEGAEYILPGDDKAEAK